MINNNQYGDLIAARLLAISRNERKSLASRFGDAVRTTRPPKHSVSLVKYDNRASHKLADVFLNDWMLAWCERAA